MVDLANGRVLRDKGAFATPDLGDVAKQQEPSDIGAVAAQRNAMDKNRGRAVLKIGATRGAAARDERECLIHLTGSVRKSRDERMEVGSDDVGDDS
ncbi:unannotated protein [freshwater metagenome]|uniref:Unannotated protein n=1 Tax=freshwater metagenome TaxID=449393 RepID=A0A6J7HH11_9ZZZZ